MAGTCISVLENALMEFEELPSEKVSHLDVLDDGAEPPAQRARERASLYERADFNEVREASIKNMDRRIAEKEQRLLQLQVR